MGFPAYSNGQLTIILCFNNGIQEGNGPIFLIVFDCKLNGQVNTVYVL